MSHLALVDDDESVRKALARLLRAHGMDVRTYASATAFIGDLGAGMPTCVIIDFHMPEGTGAGLQRELLRRGIRVPTIVLTGRDSMAQRDECRTLGAAAFLTKPVAPHELIAAISTAVEIRRCAVRAAGPVSSSSA
jgi:FixJ family two-component response regulator